MSGLPVHLCQDVCKHSSCHPFFICEFLYLSHCWKRWRIESKFFFFAFLKQSFVWWYSRCASELPWRAPWLPPSLITKIGDCHCVEPFPIQFSSEFCGNQACATSSENDPFCSILHALRTLYFGDIPHSSKHSRFPHCESSVLILRWKDFSDDFFANQHLMHLWSGDSWLDALFGWFLSWCTILLVNRVRLSSSRLTAACEKP